MGKENKVKIIEAVKTPLNFFALVIIVSEGLLFLLIKDAEGINRTILTIGCVLIPFCCMLSVYLLDKGGNKPSAPTLAVKSNVPAPSGKQYDLFVSAPMDAFESEREFKSSRNSIFDVVRAIKKNCEFDTVFYAGNEIEKKSDFDSEDMSVVEDYDACYRSNYFILIFPKKLATSALIELGWAMVYKKPIIMFAKKRSDLPFLARNADAVFSNVRIYEYKTSSDISGKFYKNGAEIFQQLEKSS